ncbi:MAG: serine--tRNA ligase [Patescibacteria group bacterium]
MIDVKLLREEPKKVKDGIAKKNKDPKLVDRFGELDAEWRKLVKEADELRAEQKKVATVRDIEAGKELKGKLKELEERIATVATERDTVWRQIPNLPLPDVIVGKDESENRPIRTWGEPTKFDFEPKDHLDLGEALGMIDVKKASEISGSRFAYLKGDIAMLEFALITHTLHTLRNEEVLKEIADRIRPGYSTKAFVPIVPPQMIRPEIFARMGRLDPPEDKYYIPSDDLYLIGSAEHTLGPLHMDETLSEDQLPIRYVGFSTSFRREAGTYGKDMKGILRVHQFDKLEMESFTTKEDSGDEQNFLVGIQEYLLQSLGLPYQVMSICTGDMGGPDARQIDIDAWMPGQGKYRETHTSDLMTDYQSRRLSIKVRREDGTVELVHMNDATAFAVGRILIAIMENYQTSDGTIRIPEVLVTYMGKAVIG